MIFEGFEGDFCAGGEKRRKMMKNRLILCVEKTRLNLFKIHKNKGNFDEW